MERDRDRLSEIERHEAWLHGYASPLPSGELLGRVKEAVCLELEATRLLGDAPVPTPPPELLARVKEQVRRELAARSRGRARAWWPSAGLSAAACLVLVVGLSFQPLGPGGGAAVPDRERELVEFAESLAGVLGAGDVQLAFLEQDVGDLERGVYGIGPFGLESIDAGLDDVRRAIDNLGDEAPLWPDESDGSDV